MVEGSKIYGVGRHCQAERKKTETKRKTRRKWRDDGDSIRNSLVFSTTTMLTSPSARPTNGDHDYFPNQKSSRMVASDVYVTTRRAWREQQAADFASTLTLNTFPDSAASTPSSSSPPPPPLDNKKRKEPHHPFLTSRTAKKSRSPPVIRVTEPQLPSAPPPKTKKRAPSSIPSSRQSSRPRTLASSPEPDDQISRSRSVSAFPAVETPILRPCWIDENGAPGPGFISNEDVIRKLIEADKGYYKGCACASPSTLSAWRY
jgi:hypothetical protein